MKIGQITDAPETVRNVARGLLDTTRVYAGRFMYVSIDGRKMPRGERVTIYPGLRGDLCNVNPNTGRIVVVVETQIVRRWARSVLGLDDERTA